MSASVKARSFASSVTSRFVAMSITVPIHLLSLDYIHYPHTRLRTSPAGYAHHVNRRPDNVQLAKFTRLLRKDPRPDGCWIFTGPGGTRDGYAHFTPHPGATKVMAHKWSYEVYKGTIPAGMQVGHVCHDRAVAAGTCDGGDECPHRRCCNPAHLEAQTPSENTTLQNHHFRNVTHCPKGHEYTDENTIIGKDGKRRCKECRRLRRQKSGKSGTSDDGV